MIIEKPFTPDIFDKNIVSVESIIYTYLNLNLEQLDDFKIIIVRKLSKLKILLKKKTKNILIWKSVWYDTNDNDELLKKIPKLVEETIEEFDNEINEISIKCDILSICHMMIRDLEIIEFINNYSFLDIKIDKLKYIESNLKNFSKISIDRFEITIRDFIDEHLKSIFKNLFPPMITSILGRIFYYGELKENYNFRIVEKNKFKVRSYDLPSLKKIVNQISNMITYLKIDIYNTIHEKNYLKYFRIFLLEKCKIILPTEIIRLIFEFIGSVEKEQEVEEYEKNIDYSLYYDKIKKIDFIKKKLKEIKSQSQNTIQRKLK